MKKIIIMLFFIAFTGAASASVLFVNPASPEGIFNQIFTELSKDIDHTYIQASNPVTASTYLDKGPSLTFWNSEWVTNSSIKTPNFDQHNIVGLLATETIMCSREFKSLSEMSDKTIKIASWGSAPVKRFLESLGKKYNIKFVVVPYDGSGSITRGYIGKDTDTVFTTLSRKTAIMTDTASVCFASSAEKTLDFQYVDAILALNGANNLTIRELLRTKMNTHNWRSKLNGVSVVLDGDLLKLFNQSVQQFK